MAIRITRNEEGNCITFIGSTNPAYWNACLSAVINSEDSDRLDIINDIRSSNSDDTQYEFYAVEYTAFADRDGNAFANAQAAVDYINANANVIGVSDVGADLTDVVVNFRLDQTSTSIIMDNGSSFGVNTIKAIADADGTIHIHAIGAGVPNDALPENDHKHFEQLDHTNVQVNGAAVSGGLQDVVNTLNELFTVGPFEAVVISDPYATRVADQTGSPAGYTLEGVDVVDPVGDDLATSTKNSHKAGIKSIATISEAGEFYTFQIRGEGQIGFGLVHTQDSYDNGYYSGNATYADPTQYKVGNNQHYGFQFSHHFHPTPNGPWTNYGANTSYSQRSGWSNATDRFISSDEGADWLAGNPVKIKCGIDENGYISISYWNESQERYIPISRSGYPVTDGSEYHLGVSTFNASARLYSAPLVHRLAASEEPTTIGTDAITAFGDVTGDLAGGVSTATGVGVNDGIITTETIDSAGEYWEVEVADNEWSIISLLYHQDNQPSTVAAAANAGPLSANDYSFFGGHIQSDGRMNGSTYKSGSGAGISVTSYTKVPDGVKWRIGFDTDGKAAIWQSQDGTTFNLMWKSQTAAPSGDYSLYWRGTTAGAGLESVAKGQLSLAPTMYFRYIESPDNNFEYPLFATAEEANYYDEQAGGSGTSHAHTYADDPTATTWYMPDTGGTMTGASAPTGDTVITGVTYTEITSLNDADLAPSQFSGSDFTYEEGTSVNLQLYPQGATWTQTVAVTPSGSGLVYDSLSGLLQGTLSDVASDTVYTVSVTRANSYGSNTGTFTVTTEDVAPAVPVSGFTLVAGTDPLVDSDTLASGSAVSVDDTVANGYRFKISDSYVTNNVLPALTATNDKVFIGFASNLASGWGQVGGGDFNCGFRFQYIAANTVKISAMLAGTSGGADINHTYSGNIGLDFYLSNRDGVLEANYNSSSTNKDTELTDEDGGTWTYSETNDTGSTQARTVVIAADGPSATDFETTGLSEHVIPAPPVTISTDWNKALDFSGSNEHLKQVSNQSFANALRLDNMAVTTTAPTWAAGTSAAYHAKPWATAIVFRADRNGSNQHIWNQGEGASSTNDNIYLRLDANGNLYFGWGRSGAINECRFGGIPHSSTGRYWGVYVAHNGRRMSGSDATAANLAAAFDIRMMTNNGNDDFATLGSNLSTSANWTSGNTGGRMDRSIAGDFTIAGRGSNRNFHGHVASMVVTTLKKDASMPSDAEIKKMVTDPSGWLTDYKVGDNYRYNVSNYSNFQKGVLQPSLATQVWLMGDGTSDSYYNGMRNQVNPSDQNYGKAQLNSMVSSDIQTVNITGLT